MPPILPYKWRNLPHKTYQIWTLLISYHDNSYFVTYLGHYFHQRLTVNYPCKKPSKYQHATYWLHCVICQQFSQIRFPPSISTFLTPSFPKKFLFRHFGTINQFLVWHIFTVKIADIHFVNNEISPTLKHSSWRSPYVWLGSTYQTYPCRRSEDMGVFRKFCAWCVSHTDISFGKYFLLADADIL
jgi:hypothetical protein